MAQKQTPLGLARDIGIGQRFQQLGDNCEFMLCQVDAGIVQLICLTTGNRWDDARIWVEDADNLTREEIIRVFNPDEYNWSRLEGK